MSRRLFGPEPRTREIDAEKIGLRIPDGTYAVSGRRVVVRIRERDVYDSSAVLAKKDVPAPPNGNDVSDGRASPKRGEPRRARVPYVVQSGKRERILRGGPYDPYAFLAPKLDERSEKDAKSRVPRKRRAGKLYLRADESGEPINTYKQKNKAKGLETILYRCIDCGALYTTEGVKNELKCTACGRAHRLNERYLFEDEPFSIGAYYAKIKEIEKAELDDLHLETDVDTVIFRDKGRYKTKEKGHCTLTKDGFSYRSDSTEYTVGFDALPALPFSVNAEFETYINGDQYYFYPTENRRQVVRWALTVDLIREMRDGEAKE
mgnify:CR=1 FL=1